MKKFYTDRRFLFSLAAIIAFFIYSQFLNAAIPQKDPMKKSFEEIVEENERLAEKYLEGAFKYFNGFRCDINSNMKQYEEIDDMRIVLHIVEIDCGKNIKASMLFGNIRGKRVDNKIIFPTLSTWKKEKEWKFVARATIVREKK